MTLALILIGLASVAFGQSDCAVFPTSSQPTIPNWDDKGNATLQQTASTYVFRYVQFVSADSSGDLSHAYSAYGTITFGSSDTYTVSTTATFYNDSCLSTGSGPVMGLAKTSPGEANISASCPVATTTATTTTASTSPQPTYPYCISSTGFGFLVSPFPIPPSLGVFQTTTTPDLIWGSVSKSGVFIGSSTETTNGYSDLFIAAPMPATTPSQTTPPTGTFSVGYINFPNGLAGNVVTAGFQITPSASGSSAVGMEMFQGSSSTPSDVTEMATNGSNGGCSNGYGFSFQPTSAISAISGTECMYAVIPAGASSASASPSTFIFGGSPSGYDLFVGVQTPPPPAPGKLPSFSPGTIGGLYYSGGIGQTISTTASGSLTAGLQTYYGALNAKLGGITSQERIMEPLRPLAPTVPPGAFSAVFADSYPAAFAEGDGYVDTFTNTDYVFSADATMRLGFGLYPNLGISIGLLAPQPPPATPPSGTTWVNVTSVVNAASFAPTTAGISPGEYLTIFGSNLVTSAAVCFGTTGVTTVVIASADQISVVAPLSLSGQSTTTVQVLTSGSCASAPATQSTAASNPIWVRVNQTTPGIFTQYEDGFGDASAYLSTDSAVIDQAFPASAGEILTLYTTGLGGLTPAGGGVIFGTPTYAPTATFTATIGGLPANISYPKLSYDTGVYQIAIEVPSGLPTGDLPLVLNGPDGAVQSTIQISGTGTAATDPGPFQSQFH